TDGWVDKNAGVVYVNAMRVETWFGPWGYGWKVMRDEILTLDLATLGMTASRPVPAPGGFRWGMSTAQDATYTYLYAVLSGERHYVARTTRAHLFDGHWSFASRSGWSTNVADAFPMRFQNGTGAPEKGPLPALTVDQYGSGFIASAKRCDLICNDITA